MVKIVVETTALNLQHEDLAVVNLPQFLIPLALVASFLVHS
jgi:hypothetical protein